MKLFYISTNQVWGGSEKLWYESVLLFLKKDCSVSLAIRYDNERIEAIKTKLRFFIDLRRRFTSLSRTKRILNKIVSVFTDQDLLLNALNKHNPDLVIISQGNNISSLDVMELCVRHNFKFVTISQLVTDLNWFWLDGALRERLVNCYEKASKNYFVSRHNLDLHQFLLAYTSANAEVIYNPYVVDTSDVVDYPDTGAGYQIAIVGRIECYHKGLDILLEVLSLKKWKDRQAAFNLYGDGPHIAIIKDLLIQLDINNVFFYGYVSVIDIWSQNHILLMPSRMEGQSLALLEALNLNRTAVVTNVGGASEIIEDNITGFMADVPTVASLDEAMERAWERRYEWEELGIEAGNKMRGIMPEDPIDFFNNRIIKILEGVNTQHATIY